jgi:[acyl-carrier-protein] S-malonyltransferase
MEEEGKIIPGGMTAIFGLKKNILEEICRESGVEIANINSPEQIVISGFKGDLDWAYRLAREKGAKRIVVLETAGAFHSRFMTPIINRMKEFISKFSFCDPKIPIIANVSAEPLTTANAVKEELLKQIDSPVQWLDSVQYMIKEGVSTFIEIGPGRVLSGLIKRINPKINIVNISPEVEARTRF